MQYIGPIVLFLLLPRLVCTQTVQLYFQPDTLFLDPGATGTIHLRVNQFIDISNADFSLAWDTSVVQVTKVSNNLSGLQFNVIYNRLVASFVSATGQGQTLPDSTVLFSFTVVAKTKPPAFTKIDFPVPPLLYRFDTGFDPAATSTTPGFIYIRQCGTVLDLGSQYHFCPGDSVKILPTCQNCQMVTWRDGSTAAYVFQSVPGWVSAIAAGPLRCFAKDSVLVEAALSPLFSLPDTLHLCPQTSAPLLPQTTQTNYTYAWSTGQQTKTITVSQPGVYSLTATNAEGCSSADTTEVVESGPTWMELVATQPNCRQVLGRIAVTQVIGGTGPYLYALNGQAFRGDPVFVDLPSGAYQAVVQDANGCEYRDTVTLRPAFIPAVTIAPVPALLEAGDSIQLRAQPAPGYPLDLIQKVVWSPLETLRFQGNTPNAVWMPVAKPLRDTWYKITTTSKDLCTASDSVLVRVRDIHDLQVYIPNVFAPDAKGDNARFTAFSTDPRLLQIERMRVYDRWGNLVFEKQGFQANSAKQGWDGNSGTGRPLESGLYVYSIEFKMMEGKLVSNSGEVTLLR